jgi:hypothetical protein
MGARDRYLSTIRCEHLGQKLAFTEDRLVSKEACERVERITDALRVLLCSLPRER